MIKTGKKTNHKIGRHYIYIYIYDCNKEYYIKIRKRQTIHNAVEKRTRSKLQEVKGESHKIF